MLLVLTKQEMWLALCFKLPAIYQRLEDLWESTLLLEGLKIGLEG
jgi:hypothetical protein